MNALLLCAGLSTRFRPHSNLLPKPAIPLLNYPLALHPLIHFNTSLISKLVVNLHYKPEFIKDLFNQRKLPWPVSFSHEVEQALGSGGAIKYAADTLGGTGSFWYINGDEALMDLPESELKAFVDFHQNSKALMTLLVIPHPEVGKSLGAVITDDEMKVCGFGKKIPDENKGYHFPGIMLIREEVIAEIPQGVSNIFMDTATPLIEKGALVNCYKTQLNWFETGDLNSYLNASKRLIEILSNDEYPIWSEKFKNLEHESQLIKTNNASIWSHKTAQIEHLDLISGFAVIGKGSRITAPLENSVIGANQLIDTQTSNSLVL